MTAPGRGRGAATGRRWSARLLFGRDSAGTPLGGGNGGGVPAVSLEHEPKSTVCAPAGWCVTNRWRVYRWATVWCHRYKLPGTCAGNSPAVRPRIVPFRSRPFPRRMATVHQETAMRSDLISGPRPLRPGQEQPRAVENRQEGGAAAAVAPLLSHFFGGPPPVRVQFWDGTSLGPAGGDTLQVCSPDAVRRILWSPSELGLARAFVVGDLAFEGDIFEMLAVLHAASPSRVRPAVGGFRGRPCVPRTGLGHSADRLPLLRKRHHRGVGCTLVPGTPRWCGTTTTSATTSTAWSSGRR